MLLLRTTLKRLPIVFFFVCVFTSCSENSKRDSEIIRALNETIDNSNRMVEASTNDIMLSFEEKLRNEGSRERAEFWYPKVKKIQQLTGDIVNYIENIKRDLNSKSESSSDLFEKLARYKAEVLSVDPKITHEFQKSLRIFTTTIDSAATNQKTLFQKYFNDISDVAELAMLNKLQNNVKLIEWKLTTYCHDHIGSLDGPGSYKITHPLIGQSSTIVQGNEQIEITAGLASISADQKPEVYVYNKLVQLDEYGLALYKLKAPSKSGKYYVPVKINYTDQDGRTRTIQREIVYTVANIQKQ